MKPHRVLDKLIPFPTRKPEPLYLTPVHPGRLRPSPALTTLSSARCVHCGGTGLVSGGTDCNCVHRAIFRVCMERFRECAAEPLANGHFNGFAYSRKNEEYIADFIGIAKRTLNADDLRLFRFRFLLGANWKLVASRLGIDRGDVFHRIYRIQQSLGKAYAETRPFALYPLSDYFQNGSRTHALPAATAA